MSITYVHIPETKVADKPLGRHVAHDDRSWNYQAEKAGQLVSAKHKTSGLPLDQGQIGSCTANALAGAMNTIPNRKAGDKLYREADAVQLYEWETAAEGQPYPPNDPGGTGLMVCKVAHQHGLIKSYTHAFGIEQALLALVVRPVITGVSWYDSFDTPSSTGMVSIAKTATVRGGHEFVAVELDVPDGATIDDLDDLDVWFENSWGKQYGVGGRFGMTAATWNTLLKDRGDVTVPVV